MEHGKSARNETDLDASGAIRVGMKPGPEAAEARWALALTIFFRAVSLLWIVEGLEQWRRIVAPASGSFLDLSAAAMSATIFFAVLNPIAAVGPVAGRALGRRGLAADPVRAGFRDRDQAVVLPVRRRRLKFADGLLLALYLFLSWRANSAPRAP